MPSRSADNINKIFRNYDRIRRKSCCCRKKKFCVDSRFLVCSTSGIKRTVRFRPCIDIHEGKVKQIVGSSFIGVDSGLEPGNKVLVNFESSLNPEFYAKKYASDGLTGGHVIMLGPGNEIAAKQALNAFPKGLQIGGGIRPENAEFWLQQGASHVIVTSYVFNEGKFHLKRLEDICRRTNPSQLVLDLSAKRVDDRYFVCTNLWQKITDFELNKPNLEFLSGYCDEFLVHAVDVEGKKQGIDDALVLLLAECSPRIVTYAGGISSMSDVELIRKLGDCKVDFTIGSALDIFGGNIRYEDLVQVRYRLTWKKFHKFVTTLLILVAETSFQCPVTFIQI
eukprot:jgi/Galph1/3823/GphlegSOOS_G2492.1